MSTTHTITPAAVYLRQPNKWTCGPVALKMALALQQVDRALEELIAALGTTEQAGTPHAHLIRFAQENGFEYQAGGNTSIGQVRRWREDGYAVVVAYYDIVERCGHFAVVDTVTDKRIHLLDPWFGPEHSYSIGHFYRRWHDSEGYRRWALAIRRPR